MKREKKELGPQDAVPSEFCSTAVGEVSLTKQSFAEEADINYIVGRFHRTGAVEYLNSRQGVFGDFSGVGDFRSALDRCLAAQEAFEGLPSRVRDHFQNDPALLLEAFDDPARRAELEGLGLVAPAAAEASEVQPAAAPAGSTVPNT